MKANANFDLLFKTPVKSDFENKEIFKKAALLFEFNLEQEFSTFPEAEVELLKSKAFLRNNGRYILPEELRLKIIKEEIGVENISEAIINNKIKTDFSETLLKISQSNQLDYQSFSDSELFYLTKFVELFPQKLNIDAIKTELQHRYYFAPFVKITENFAGRKKELGQVNDYVDWLPKEGFMNQSIGFFRNIINWHEKPPLLIQGIGGIGKSTLISKFIIDNNNEKDGKTLPFIYIDFDLSGFSLTEPLSILLEGLRQLSIQYNDQQPILAAISRNISDMINYNKNPQSEIYQSSNATSRGLIFNSVEGLIEKYKWGLEKINTPILIVFDSFEEMQYRASRDEMNIFFSFIREISEKIPRLRPIFIGRSEISESTVEFKFDVIELTSFDETSADALLINYGIEDSTARKKIFSSFGGNPLLLRLATDLIKKDKNAIKDLDKIIDKKHEYLVNRILEQIHDPYVRKIAVPGMLLRNISPDIIKDVLAIPCKLGQIDNATARKIFDNLTRETALISRSFDDDELLFRQDLRRACEKMILDKYPEESRQIKQNAIEYFNKNKSVNEDFEAEYYFHVLKSGNIPSELTRETYLRLRTKFENSLTELPANSQLFLKSLIGARVSDTILKQSGIIEWENYYLSQIMKGLNGELDFLKKLYREISSRKERSENPGSHFPLFEALLYQRLNRLSQSDNVIERNLQLNQQSGSLSYELRFIKAQNLEYEGKYEDALLICENNHADESSMVNEFAIKKNEFLNLRLAKRCGHEGPKINSGFVGYVPNKDDMFIDVHWNYIFRHFEKYNFLNANEFDYTYSNYFNNLSSDQDLERYVLDSLSVYSKDIALSGVLEILVKDFLFIMELKGDIKFVNNLNMHK